MGRFGALGLGIALGACATPAVETPGAPRPVACASATTPGIAASELAVATTPSGAVVAWADRGALMTVALAAGGGATAAPAIAWPGTYDRAVATTIDGEVVVGAVAGETTTLVGAPLGIGELRELALLGGIAGASPIVVAGGQRVAPNVWYGGLLVASVDELWTAHTAELAVQTSAATELAATVANDEAVIAWPAGDACFVAVVVDAATATAWHEPGVCRAPRLAALAGGVALAFERDDGVYLARADSAAALHPELATLVAPGAHAPRLVAAGGAYWLSYLDVDASVVVGFVDTAGALQTTALQAATAHELAVFGDAPRVLAIDSRGLTATALCPE